MKNETAGTADTAVRAAMPWPMGSLASGRMTNANEDVSLL